MINVQLFINDELTSSFQFNDLLDGVMYIYRSNIEFDVMRVDDDIIVRKHEFRRYLTSLNSFYKNVYGTWYEL